MKKTLLGAILLSAIAVVVFLLNNSPKVERNKVESSTQTEVEITEKLSEPKHTDQSKKKSTSKVKVPFQNEEETHSNEEESSNLSATQKKYLKSLNSLNSGFAKAFKYRKEPNELIHFLEEQGLSPKINKKSNSFLGVTWEIRTNKSLPGTRYYNAQYDGDDEDHLFLKYLSYEYAPGEKSFEQVIKSLENSYSIKNKDIISPGENVHLFIERDHVPYTITIKKMNLYDINNDPTYPHTEDDIGTISVRLQLNMEDEH